MHTSIISSTVFKNQSKDGLMIRDPLTHRINQFIDSFAKFDKYSQSYEFDYKNLDDFQKEELAAICMTSDDNWAAEATGADNPAYDKKMLPALIATMRDPFDKDLEIEFKNAWRQGVSSYFEKYLSEKIYDLLCEYNSDQGFNFNPETEYATSGNRG